jgi:hypothetical protein
MFVVTESDGSREEYADYTALHSALHNSATDEYTGKVLEWASRRDRPAEFIIMNGKEPETWTVENAS